MQKSLKSLFCFVKLTKYIFLHSPLKRVNAAGQVIFVYPRTLLCINRREMLFLRFGYNSQKSES